MMLTRPWSPVLTIDCTSKTCLPPTLCLPFSRKRECVSELVYRMCEENAVDKLMTFNFAGFADEVEDALAFKSRNADPRVRPFYSRILYAWYTLRGDYRNGKLFLTFSIPSSTLTGSLAALTMYQRARKLHDLVGDPAQLLALAEEQLEAYMVAMNSLALIDRPSAWFLIPMTTDNGLEVCTPSLSCTVMLIKIGSQGKGASYQRTYQSQNTPPELTI